MDGKAKDWAGFNEKYFRILLKYIFLPLLMAGVVLFFFHNFIGILVIVGSCFVVVLGFILLIVLKPLIVKKYPESTVPQAGYPSQREAERRMAAADNSDYFGGDLPCAETGSAPQYRSSQVPAYDMQKAVKLASLLNSLGMTEAQILATPKNPFVPQIWRMAGLFLLFAVCTGVVIGLGERFLGNSPVVDTVSSILGILSTLFAYKVVDPIMSAIHFRKAKRLLSARH